METTKFQTPWPKSFELLWMGSHVGVLSEVSASTKTCWQAEQCHAVSLELIASGLYKAMLKFVKKMQAWIKAGGGYLEYAVW